MLRPTLPRIGRSLRTFHRSLHSVPPLTHNFREGVPGLLSPNGFDMAWTQYQSLMVEKLNVLIAGMSTSIEGAGSIRIISGTRIL
jgi:Fe-Mn family superoxide dismutase